MADGPSYTIGVVCEAAADRRIACDLVDRVLEAKIGWASGLLETLREFRGLDDSSAFLAWDGVPQQC